MTLLSNYRRVSNNNQYFFVIVLQLVDPFALHLQLQPVPLVAMAVREYSKGTPKSDRARAANESDSDSDSDDEGSKSLRVSP